MKDLSKAINTGWILWEKWLAFYQEKEFSVENNSERRENEEKWERFPEVLELQSWRRKGVTFLNYVCALS